MFGQAELLRAKQPHFAQNGILKKLAKPLSEKGTNQEVNRNAAFVFLTSKTRKVPKCSRLVEYPNKKFASWKSSAEHELKNKLSGEDGIASSNAQRKRPSFPSCRPGFESRRCYVSGQRQKWPKTIRLG